MFVLKKKIVGGYKFGERTFYKTRHLGTDYRARYETLYAPFSGTIKRVWGPQGGSQIHFWPDNKKKHGDVLMRFMHLSKYLKPNGKVKKGDKIAITGNSGTFTTCAHLHLDISKKTLQIWNFSNFTDPEKYKW
jgi:murein DD-endopeptidase MepM/ murein hydrolase activator NlpD